MNQPTKLTEFQLNRILDRFTSKSSVQTFLSQAYQTANNIIVTDSYMALFLSNSATETSIINEFESEKDIKAFIRMEKRHITHSDYDPSTQLTLDSDLIQNVIQWHINQRKVKSAKQTKTRIEYRRHTNKIAFATVKMSNRFIPTNEDSFTVFYCHPSSVLYHRDEDFSVIIDTNYLIHALTTQKETGQFTTIEYSDTQSSYIKMVNDVSTIVIARIKEQV